MKIRLCGTCGEPMDVVGIDQFSDIFECADGHREES